MIGVYSDVGTGRGGQGAMDPYLRKWVGGWGRGSMACPMAPFQSRVVLYRY